jgi:UDP-glucose-4-epimerase GalE
MSDMADSSILIVGGAGYIGSHMTKALSRQGFEATVFDNLSRGHRNAVDCEFVEGNLLVPSDLKDLFSRRRYDLVMHFAALAYVGESVTEPRAYYENNVVGTVNLLNAMLDAGIDRFVFSSTCATYGNPVEIPMTEDHPQRPINPYGRTKLMVEEALRDYAEAYGLKSIALRYFNAAGCDRSGELGERHDPETHLIPLILREALRVRGGGRPEETRLKVFGDDFDTPDGTCIRDYIHVEDLSSAHLLAARRLLEGRCAGAEAYNLGNGQGFSVLEVIEACRQATGIDIRYSIDPRRPGDPPRLVGSAEKARDILGWRPEITDLREIIATAWSWFAKNG